MAQARLSYARLPLAFERNAGQVADKSAAWVGRVNGYNVALGATGATIAPAAAGRSDVVRMQFLEARSEAIAKPLEPLPGKTNYLVGRDSKRWIQNLLTYGRIEYQDVYDGIDVAWYGNQGQLEYDFLVQPGADPNRIRVRFEGTRKLTIDSAGDVRIETAAGSLKLRVPEVYQEIAGARKRVEGRCVLRATNEIGFELVDYDRSKPLVIDPTLVYGTYFGGSGMSVTAITTDAAGNVYIGGSASDGLPVVNPVQPGMLGNGDVWVAKFNPTGTVLLYSTYVGGRLYDAPSGLAVTAGGELIATGSTSSPDFPLVNAAQSQGPVDPAYSLPFAFKLNPSGSAFVYSTYLGGAPPQGANARAVATDTAGDAYIAGEAHLGFATTAGAYQSSYGGGWSDSFVVKLGPTGALIYSTLVGGAGQDSVAAIAADSAGHAYIAGNTGSSSFPGNPPGAVTTNAGNLDTFVAKLNADGTGVAWLTFLGGTGDDLPTAMVRDSASGKLYVAGSTTSMDLPATAGAIQPVSHGPKQGFIVSIDPDGMSLGFVTYLGGGREDTIQGIALTPSGQLAVAGSTTSTGFPTADAIQPSFSGSTTSLYVSTNYGASWSPADSGLPAEVIAIAPDPSNPGTILAASGSSFAWFRTTDNAASWTPSGASSLYQGWHVSGAQFVRSPSNPAVVYFCVPYSNGQGIAPAIVSNVIAFGSNDGGTTWRLLAAPPTASWDSLMGVAVSPTDPNKILEVTFSGAVFRSTDGGASFTQLNSLPSFLSYGFSADVAGSADGSVYVGTMNGIYRSPDFGTTWTLAGGYFPEIGSIAVSASNPSVAYAASSYSNAIIKTSDAGAIWGQVAPPRVGLVDYWTSLAVAPSDAQVVYVASGYQVVVSTDGGTTWSSPVTLPNGIWAIAVSPSDPATIWAAVGNVTSDGFAAKVSSDGKTLLWSTFYTGSWGAAVNGVAAEPSGDVWIAGNSSTELPITANAYSQYTYYGTAFLARISDATAACSYSLNPSSVVSYGAQTTSFAVTAPSGCAWTAASSDATWISVSSGAAGTGSGVVSVTLTANGTGSTRTGSVNVNGVSFAITQADSSCTYLHSHPANLPSTGGTVEITVTAPNGCPWSVIPNSPLVSVISGGSGTGNGAVTLSLPANDGVQWFNPAVWAGPEGVSLQQANACSYSLSPLTLGPAAHSGAFNVSANLAQCYWFTQSNAGWLSSSHDWSYGSSQVPYSVTLNNTGSARTAQLTIDQRQFTATQLARTPTAAFRDTSGGIQLLNYGETVPHNGGGVFAGDPGATQNAAGDTFVVNRDTFNAVWANVFNVSTQTWGSWAYGGGATQGDPAIAVATNGTAYIAVRDTWNSYWITSYTPASGFGTWTYLAGIFSTDPVMAAAADGSVYIIGKDTWNSLWSGQYIPASGFQGWRFGGGIVRGKPSVVVGSDNMAYIAARDMWDSLWMARVQGNAWLGWSYGGGIMSADPLVVAPSGSGAIHATILDPWQVPWYIGYTEGTSGGWQSWTQMGGVLQSASVATLFGDGFAAGVDANNDLWWWRSTGNEWTNTGNRGVAAGPLVASPR